MYKGNLIRELITSRSALIESLTKMRKMTDVKINVLISKGDNKKVHTIFKEQIEQNRILCVAIITLFNNILSSNITLVGDYIYYCTDNTLDTTAEGTLRKGWDNNNNEYKTQVRSGSQWVTLDSEIINF